MSTDLWFLSWISPAENRLAAVSARVRLGYPALRTWTRSQAELYKTQSQTLCTEKNSLAHNSVGLSEAEGRLCWCTQRNEFTNWYKLAGANIYRHTEQHLGAGVDQYLFNSKPQYFCNLHTAMTIYSNRDNCHFTWTTHLMLVGGGI